MTIMAAGMIRIFHIKRMLVASFLLIISSWLQAGVEMNRFKNYTFWDFIEILDQAMPLDKENAEVLFGSELVFIKKRGKRDEWGSQNIVTNDNVLLEDIIFLLNEEKSLENGGFLKINIKDQCITVDSLKEKINGLVLFSGPRGHSVMDTTVWSATRKWGSIYFSFRELNRDCLAYITFESQ